MFKELTLQKIWESVMPVENDSTLKFKSTLWWPVLVEGLNCKLDKLVSPFSWFSLFRNILVFSVLEKIWPQTEGLLRNRQQPTPKPVRSKFTGVKKRISVIFYQLPIVISQKAHKPRTEGWI